MKVVIPIAGQGKRLLPISKYIPKELMPVVDKPAIWYAIRECIDFQAEEVILVSNTSKHAVIDYVKETFQDQIKITVVKQVKAAGLGDAILKAKKAIGRDKYFAVLLPDEIMESGLLRLKYQLHPSLLLMEVPGTEVSNYGIAELMSNFSIRKLLEKPSTYETNSRAAIIGRYVLPNSIFGLLNSTKPDRNGEVQLTSALNELERLYGIMYYGDRNDIGSLKKYAKTNYKLYRRYFES